MQTQVSLSLFVFLRCRVSLSLAKHWLILSYGTDAVVSSLPCSCCSRFAFVKSFSTLSFFSFYNDSSKQIEYFDFPSSPLETFKKALLYSLETIAVLLLWYCLCQREETRWRKRLKGQNTWMWDSGLMLLNENKPKRRNLCQDYRGFWFSQHLNVGTIVVLKACVPNSPWRISIKPIMDLAAWAPSGLWHRCNG